MIEKDGYIYIVSNPAMPGRFFSSKRYLKIGMTSDIRNRLKSLSNTSVPLPFVVEHLLYVPDRFIYESVIHAQLDKYRVSDEREYFYLSPKKAIRLIHGKRSKVFELAQSNSMKLKPDDNSGNVLYLSESNETHELKKAKDRTPTSKTIEIAYQRKLDKVRAEIDGKKQKAFQKFTAEKAKEFGLHNKRFSDAKRDLKKSGHLVRVGKGASLYSKYATAVMAA